MQAHMKMRGASYEHQFNKVYDARLVELRTHIERSARAATSASILDAIMDVKAGNGIKTCVVVGTLFIVSDLKPSIFDKIDRSSKKVLGVGLKTYYSKEVRYFLEDCSGRIEIEFRDTEAMYRKHFVVSTGMCLGVVGGLADNGRFLADDVVFPFASLQSIQHVKRKGQGRICFVSGPEIDLKSDSRSRLMVVVDYLRMLGVEEYLVFGNLFADAERADPALFSELDMVLRRTDAKVSLVPDINDLGARVLPLTPIHPKLLRTPATPLSNPCRISMAGRIVLATTQFVLDDLLRYIPQEIQGVQGEPSEYKMHVDESQLENCVPEDMNATDSNIINAMVTLIKAGHVCPTAPDTLPSAPFAEEDPFTVTEHVDYFCVGNADRFMEVTSTHMLFFTVPRFSKTHEVVVLDAESSRVEVVRFDMKNF